MKQRNNLKVTYELLHELLNLRKDVEIIDVISGSTDRRSEIIFVKILSNDCNLTPEGQEIMWRPIEDFQERKKDEND